jgi:hypothetical protein
MSLPVRFHHLKTIGTKSPAHLRRLLLVAEDDQTYSMERGTATHALLFGTRKVVGYHEGKQRRGKEWDAFEAANTDAEILSASDYERATRMAEAVSVHADAMRVLTGTQEQTILWKQQGRDCRATPDNRTIEFVTELKTTKDSQPDKFTRQAIWMGYHAQLAWYMQAMLQSGKGLPREAFIVAVESSAPYPVTVLRLTKRALEMGERLVRLWWERLRACEESGEWPAYVQNIVDLDVPEDDELIFGDDVEAA